MTMRHVFSEYLYTWYLCPVPMGEHCAQLINPPLCTYWLDNNSSLTIVQLQSTMMYEISSPRIKVTVLPLKVNNL